MSDQPNPQGPAETPRPPSASPTPPPPEATQQLGYPPGYPPQPGMMMPPGYPPQAYMGYPQGYPMPPGYPMPQAAMPGQPADASQPYAYPPGYPPHPGMMMPPGYPMPQGYPMGYPQGYPMPQGMPMPMPGQPQAGFPQPAAPGHPGVPAPSAASAPVAVPSPASGPVLAKSPAGAPQGKAPAPAAKSPAPPAPSLPVPAPAAAPSLPVPAPASKASTAVPVAEEGAAAVLDGEAPVSPFEGVYHPPALTHIAPVKPPNAFVRAWRKVGGASLTLSVAIHGGIFALAFTIVIAATQAEKQVDFLPGGGTAKGAQASADMQHKVQQKKRNSLNKTAAMKRIVSNSSTAAVTLPDAPPDLLDVPDVGAMLGGGSLGGGGFGKAGAGGGFGTGMGMGSMQGFVTLPPSMKQRCSPQERLQKLAQNGGNAECERAVSASLEWLKQKQNKDGSWGASHKAAYTGMVLLCFLGRCETPDSPFYGDSVMKGIMYLVELSKKSPEGIICETPKAISGAYEHGIATYALGEMYTLARLGNKELPGMREAFVKGVELIIKTQNKDGKALGSWDYYTRNILEEKKFTSGREDLSVAGWQFQALKAAKFTGLKIDGLHSAIDKTCDYIVNVQSKDGGYGKTKRDDHYNQWSLTGVGVLGLQTLSKGRTASIKKGLGFLRKFLTDEPLDWNKNCNLYCWYYYTQAFFQAGGDDWKFYNEQFLPQILAAQNPDGSFKAGRANWPAGDAKDPIYRQCLCTLQLEVYYRYLKVGDREEESFFDRQ